MSKTFNQNFEELLQEYHAKKTIPDWFTTGYKTLVSKNVTIEDWNRMYLYLQNLASDDEVLLKLLEFVKNNIEQRFEDFKKENDLVIEGQWASDIYTENLHVDVIRNDPEFYFMDNTGRFQSHRISEKPDFTYVDTNYVSLTKSQAIDGVKEFKNILKIIGDDTKGRIIPTVNDTGFIGQPNNHFKQGYINQMIAYQVLPIEKTGTSLGTGIGSIGNANNRWLNATIDNIVTKSILINNKAAATEDFVNSKISELLNSAPETLDTLAELAEALGKDPNFATTIANQIGNKADRTELPKNLSELNNDAGYLVPSSLTNYATKTFVADEIRKAQLETEDVDLSIFYTKTEINEREIYTFVDLTPTGIDYSTYKIIDFFNMLQDLGYADLTNDVVNCLKIKLKYDGIPITFLEFKFVVFDDELQISYASMESYDYKYIGTYFAYTLDDAESNLFGLTESLNSIITLEMLQNYLPKSGGGITGNLTIDGDVYIEGELVSNNDFYTNCAECGEIYSHGRIYTESTFFTEAGMASENDIEVTASHGLIMYEGNERLGFGFDSDGHPAISVSEDSENGYKIKICPNGFDYGYYVYFSSSGVGGKILTDETLNLYHHNVTIRGTNNSHKFMVTFDFVDAHWGYGNFKTFCEYCKGRGFSTSGVYATGSTLAHFYRMFIYPQNGNCSLYYIQNSIDDTSEYFIELTSSAVTILNFDDRCEIISLEEVN